jgi:hypothetical protein
MNETRSASLRALRSVNSRASPASRKFPQNPRSNGYAAGMTKLLDQAVERVQALPAEMHDEAARMFLVDAGDKEHMIELIQEEEADLNEALSEMARGEFASEAEVASVFSKYVCETHAIRNAS